MAPEDDVSHKRTELERCHPGSNGGDVALTDLADALRQRFLEEGKIEDMDEAIKLHRAALELHPPDHPLRSSSLRSLALCLSDRYDHQEVVADLDEAIMLARAVVELHLPGDPDCDLSLRNLGRYLRRRSQELGATRDLDEAIKVLRAALELCPPEHPRRQLPLLWLNLCFLVKYDDQWVVADLDEAIALSRAALEFCPPGDDTHGLSLHVLGHLLVQRFEKLAVMRNLEEAIELHREVLELHPPGHPRRSTFVRLLASCLRDRYHHQGGVTSLNEAITLGRAESELCQPGQPDRGISLYNLGRRLTRPWKRSQKLTAKHDLDEAIELYRVASESHLPEGPSRSSMFHSLALCLLDRYDYRRVAADLDEAIKFSRAAVELCLPGQPKHGLSVDILAFGLRMRFQELATIRDLEEAIGLLRETLERHPPGDSLQSSLLRPLALCLSDRYDHGRVVADLDDAIKFSRTAVELSPPGHSEHDSSVDILSLCLVDRFRELATISDLEVAIELHREALELHPPGDPLRSSLLWSFALCLFYRYRHRRADTDFEEAVMHECAGSDLHLLGRPKRGLSLSTLTRNLWARYQPMKSRSGKANSLRQATMVSYSERQNDIASSLHTVSIHYWNDFQKQATLADLDEAICLATHGLELRLPEHPDYVVSLQKLSFFIGERLAREITVVETTTLARAVDNLCVLGRYLKDRSLNKHSVADLGAAVTLHKYVLQLRPNVHPGFASDLDNLVLCLMDEFRRTAIMADLEDAIELGQKALDLSPPEDPCLKMRQTTLANCIQMKISPPASRVSTTQSAATEHNVNQAIRNVVSETLDTMPTRLPNTHTGVLCDRAAQRSQFMNSQQCKQLLLSATPSEPVIRTAVLQHFQFVMFSHRWGEGEPVLRDIRDRLVYDVSPRGGVKKLQNFCRTALAQGYQWAWSDTCCIDKDSSAELQEAIVAMFGWYRRSALTIVYLADVRESGSFVESDWFRRGWTLQELLAPCRILFYTRSWTLYKNVESSNHKTDGAVLEEIERSTGIAPRFLTNFSPGIYDARSRLQWASLRRTSRGEDIAYSLFGIFNINNLHISYGESAEDALGRLLAEIISRSGDISILDWVGVPSPFHSCFPASITSYGTLPSSPFPPEEQSLTVAQQATPSKALRKFCGTLTKSSLPRFINRRLILPCLSYRVDAVRLKSADASSPSYTYEIQASGLKPLEITLPEELESAIALPDALQLARPWHSKSLGGSTKSDRATTEELLATLGRPFHALLLTVLPHNEYKRVASSTVIVAQPMDSACILRNKLRTFEIV